MTTSLFGNELEVVCLADSRDLFEVVSAVDELEHAPLVDAEWAEDQVAGTSTCAEQAFGFCANTVEI